MKLKCKKTYYITNVPIYMGDQPTKSIRIKEGEYYEVMQKHTKSNGERYWCFLIPDKINPKGSGWFDIDEYFETPEEVRDSRINEILDGSVIY